MSTTSTYGFFDIKGPQNEVVLVVNLTFEDWFYDIIWSPTLSLILFNWSSITRERTGEPRGPRLAFFCMFYSATTTAPHLSGIRSHYYDGLKFVCIDFSSQQQKRRKALCIQTDLFLSFRIALPSFRIKQYVCVWALSVIPSPYLVGLIWYALTKISLRTK